MKYIIYNNKELQKQRKIIKENADLYVKEDDGTYKSIRDYDNEYLENWNPDLYIKTEDIRNMTIDEIIDAEIFELPIWDQISEAEREKEEIEEEIEENEEYIKETCKDICKRIRELKKKKDKLIEINEKIANLQFDRVLTTNYIREFYKGSRK